MLLRRQFLPQLGDSTPSRSGPVVNNIVEEDIYLLFISFLLGKSPSSFA